MFGFENYWTFPVPRGNELVVASADREGLILLNSTAAWIWEHSCFGDLPGLYADHFGIPLEQAESDIRVTKDSWELLHAPPATPLPVVSEPSTFYSAGVFKVGEALFQINFGVESIAREMIPRLAPIKLESTRVREFTPAHTFDLTEFGENQTAIFLDGSLLATAPTVTACRAIVLQELTRLAIPNRDFKLILHAGAVGDSEACVILAGASFSGKSTLCAALMQSGLVCYSDDSACLTSGLKIAGMPFAISLREGSWPLFPELDRPRFVPSNLKGSSPEAKAVGLIFVNYDSRAGMTTMDAVSTFDALAMLNASGFWVEHSEPAIGSFLGWLGDLPVRQLRYSDLQDAVFQVREYLKIYSGT